MNVFSNFFQLSCQNKQTKKTTVGCIALYWRIYMWRRMPSSPPALPPQRKKKKVFSCELRSWAHDTIRRVPELSLQQVLFSRREVLSSCTRAFSMTEKPDRLRVCEDFQKPWIGGEVERANFKTVDYPYPFLESKCKMWSIRNFVIWILYPYWLCFHELFYPITKNCC